MNRLLIGALMALVTVAGNAAGDPEPVEKPVDIQAEFPDAIACNALAFGLKGTVKALYESALIADYVFSEDEDKRLINPCSDHVSFAWEYPMRVSTFVTHFTKSNLGWQPFENLLHDHNVFVEDDNTAHISCSPPSDFYPRISVSFDYVSMDTIVVNDDDTTSRIPLRYFIVFKVGVLATKASNWFSGEETVDVHHFSDPSDNQEYVLFEGTKFLDPSSWNSSLDEIFGDEGSSCAPDVAATIVGSISEILPDGVTLVVAGHSLGGAVTQYIAADREQNSTNYNPNVQYISHSFNAVGIKDATFSPKELYSFFIDREILSNWREELGMTQVGKLIRYIPIAGSDLDKAGSLKRHSLESVKSGLCACLSGTGCVNLQ